MRVCMSSTNELKFVFISHLFHPFWGLEFMNFCSLLVYNYAAVDYLFLFTFIHSFFKTLYFPVKKQRFMIIINTFDYIMVIILHCYILLTLPFISKCESVSEPYELKKNVLHTGFRC